MPHSSLVAHIISCVLSTVVFCDEGDICMEEGSVELPVFLKMFHNFLKNIEETSNQK